MAKKQKDKAAAVWGLTRISLGLIFVWAFVDKLFGLGFATCRDAKTDAVTTMCEKAWLSGGSPTEGFLKFGTQGPFEGLYQSMAGNAFVDVLFMAGLLLIGLALVAGIGMKVATVSGVLLLMMMWSAVLPPENHPVIDDHIINSLVLIGLLLSNERQRFGFRKWWVKQPLVQKYPVLE